MNITAARGLDPGNIVRSEGALRTLGEGLEGGSQQLHSVMLIRAAINIALHSLPGEVREALSGRTSG